MKLQMSSAVASMASDSGCVVISQMMPPATSDAARTIVMAAMPATPTSGSGLSTRKSVKPGKTAGKSISADDAWAR